MKACVFRGTAPAVLVPSCSMSSPRTSGPFSSGSHSSKRQRGHYGYPGSQHCRYCSYDCQTSGRSWPTANRRDAPCRLFGGNASEEAQPGVGASAAELAAWYRTVPGLEIVTEAPTSLCSLSGIALDFRVSDAWRSPCPLGGFLHAVPIMIGGRVSKLYHVAGAPLEIRLILLDWRGGNVAIEVTALRKQRSLNDYLTEAGAGAVIDSFKFGS